MSAFVILIDEQSMKRTLRGLAFGLVLWDLSMYIARSLLEEWSRFSACGDSCDDPGGYATLP